MTLTVSFELNDKDLTYLTNSAMAAKEAIEMGVIDAKQMTADTARLIEESVSENELPDFVTSRLDTLKVLVEMVNDEQWNLTEPERTRVLSAMYYFVNPDDLIPDSIPGIGFLDDAIMIELVAQELEPEISSYQEFCEYRSAEENRRANQGKNLDVTFADWLADKRATLHSRMRERRARRHTAGLSRLYS
jgi:uncharacterized membrane protein YkvA (DUF1232 family)